MQKSGYIRWILSLFICFLVLLFNFYGGLKTLYISENKFIVPAGDGELFAEENSVEELPQITEPEPEKSETEDKKGSSDETIQTSAKDIKGNIITKYISPYTAGSSYDKVYIKNSTGTSVDIKKLLEAKLGYNIEENSDAPQVLILHTHATESFMTENTPYYTTQYSSRNRDNSKNMVKIGEIVASRLNEAGIKTVHDKTLHDYPEYTGSYTRAAKTINDYLKKYPSIKVVLDLHRDAVTSGESDKVKLVSEIKGKKAAQVMLVMGSQTGTVTGHSKWQENLKLAFKVQQKLEQKYPTLARPLLLMSKLYNQNLSTGALLIEFGTDANTLDEACYSAELVGTALAEVLKE